MIRRVVEASGRPCVFTLTQRHARPTVWRDLLGYADEAIAAGVSIRPVVAPRAIGVLLGLEGSQNPFSGTPTYQSIAHLPLAERVRRMRDPEFRRQDPVRGSEEGQHLPAVPPAVVRPDVPLRQSAELPAAAARTRSPRSPSARAARRRRSPTTCCSRTTATTSSTRRSATTPTTICRSARPCWRIATRSWVLATAARMSRSSWMPAIRPGC